MMLMQHTDTGTGETHSFTFGASNIKVLKQSSLLCGEKTVNPAVLYVLVMLMYQMRSLGIV